MKWTVEEDEICCRACVDEYVINKSHMNVEFCIKFIMNNPNIKRDSGTLKMRIQNIKAILDEWKVPNTLNISPLNHAGRQTRAILKALLEENGIEISLA